MCKYIYICITNCKFEYACLPDGNLVYRWQDVDPYLSILGFVIDTPVSLRGTRSVQVPSFGELERTGTESRCLFYQISPSTYPYLDTFIHFLEIFL